MKDCILNESIYNSKSVLGSFNEVGGSNKDAIQYNFYIDKQAVLNNIALWSNPAWLNTDEKSICIRIVSEWVYHNRIWTAIDRTTIAEVVSSVRGIIPRSKLASYGDYRYDLDIETLYDNLDGTQPEIFNDECDDTNRDSMSDNTTYSRRDCDVIKYETKEKIEGKFAIDCPTSSDVRMLVNKIEAEKQLEDCGRSELDQWLSKWKDFLKNVRSAVGKSDPWTDTLLKVCYRFFTAARDNQSLMQLLEKEMPMIIDYRQLYTEPIQIMELMSLPQPYLEESLNLSSTETDALWLKLSSGEIRKLWPKNDATDKIFPNADISAVSIGDLNFLRRRQIKLATKSSFAEVEITEDETKWLLGSLINFIDGFNDVIDESETPHSISNTIGDASVKTFSEVHGQWNKSRCSNGPNDAVPKIKRECNQKMFNQPTHTLSIPPPNWIFTPQSLRMTHPNLHISSPTVHAPQSAIFQPSILSMPASQVPIYYMPATHFVRREGEYYVKCRQRLSLNNLNALGIPHKIQDQPLLIPSKSLQSPISPEHILVTRSCNQQQIRHLFPTVKTVPKQHGYSISFQQNMMSRMPTQVFQVLRHMPLKLGKTDSVHKEISKNEILQNNASNRISDTKVLLGISSCPSRPSYYQSVENPLYKKLLKQPTMEGTTNVVKIRTAFPIVFVPKNTTDSLFHNKKVGNMIDRKIKFMNEKSVEFDSILLQSNNEKDQQASNNKSKVGYKAPSKRFTQKCIAQNCRIYKTRFFKRESLTNFKWELMQKFRKSTKINVQRRDLQKEIKIRKSLNKVKISTKLLSDRYKGNTLTQKCGLFKKLNSSRHRPNHIPLENDAKKNKPKHFLQNIGVNDQNLQCRNCADSFLSKVDAKSPIKKDKCTIPVTAEYLNDVADYLLFDDEYDQGKFSNAASQKIDGWIHLKITLLTIIKRASLMLNKKEKNLNLFSISI